MFCFQHKANNMVNVKYKTCFVSDCYKLPSFNYENNLPMYCKDHKEPGMIDVKSKLCHTELCTNYAYHKKFQGYCFYCFVNTFPDEPIVRNYKIKERHVTDFLREKFPDLKFIFDRTAGGCSLRRADVYIDLITHVIIIEIDEDQHRYYSTTCEMQRLNELYEDFGCRPIIFIRFNPDGYVLGSKKISSPFGIHKSTGLLIVKNKQDWGSRLENLEETVKDHLEKVPENNYFEMLYYDS